MKILFPALAALTAILFCQASTAHAERAFGLTTQNSITVFDTADPTVSLSGGAVTGLAANESLVALDYQPATGRVFLLGNLSNVYTLDSTAGDSFAATQLGTTLNPALAGTSFAFDFNPAFMAGGFSRIITDTDDNRVISGASGDYLPPVEKADVFYAVGDVNEGADPNIAGIAYDTNIAGATSTQQYGIDASLGILTTVANNAGTLETVGSLGILGSITNELGFDISGETGVAYAAIQNSPNSQLYTVDLALGLATPVGVIGSGDLIRDLTIVPVPEPTTVALIGLLGVGVMARRQHG